MAKTQQQYNEALAVAQNKAASQELANLISSKSKRLGGSKKPLSQEKMKELSALWKREVKKEAHKYDRISLANIINDILDNKNSKIKFSYKVYNHGEAITYIDIFKLQNKVGRVKISQGRNRVLSLCYEKFDQIGSRYIKLYTHNQIMKNKTAFDSVGQTFTDTIFEKYISLA